MPAHDFRLSASYMLPGGLNARINKFMNVPVENYGADVWDSTALRPTE
jgi:hypothetical protein